MFNEFLQYINTFITAEELLFAFVGLIILIFLWFAERKV